MTFRVPTIAPVVAPVARFSCELRIVRNTYVGLLLLVAGCGGDEASSPVDAAVDTVSVDAAADDAPTDAPNDAPTDGSPDAPIDGLPAPRYATSFDGTCPDGWTLSGDWECGNPANVGPASAFDGTQCLGTKVAGPYSNLQTWATATATSPEIDLSGPTPPILTFRMWLDTEGVTYDGGHLEVVTGTTSTVLTSVTPAYDLTIGGQPAWGGHQAAAGWQLVTADLSAYAGQTIRLRFAFQSDSSGVFPGVYLDDLRLP